MQNRIQKFAKSKNRLSHLFGLQSNETRESGYYSLVGHIIRQAILDYRCSRFDVDIQTKKRRKIFVSAKNFLFTDRLEKFIHNLNLGYILDPKRIRECAKA